MLQMTAGDGLSGVADFVSAIAGAVSLALDLNELTAATVDVSADSIAIIDGGDIAIIDGGDTVPKKKV